GLTMNELLRRVAQLPPHTVILSTIFIEDAWGQFFLQEEALDLITRAANAPVYGIYSSYIGHGVVGGRMTDPENLGRRIAGLAGRVLNGENAASIPIVVDNSSRTRWTGASCSNGTSVRNDCRLRPWSYSASRRRGSVTASPSRR